MVEIVCDGCGAVLEKSKYYSFVVRNIIAPGEGVPNVKLLNGNSRNLDFCEDCKKDFNELLEDNFNVARSEAR